MGKNKRKNVEKEENILKEDESSSLESAILENTQENKDESKDITEETTQNCEEQQTITTAKDEETPLITENQSMEQLLMYDKETKPVEEEEIPEVKIQVKKKKNGLPPKKVKVNGTLYYRKINSFEDRQDLNEQDLMMIQKGNKIKYHPPLSYRWLKIFGIIAMVLPFMLLRILVSFPDMSESVIDILATVANTLALPLIVFTAFVIILKNKEKKRQIIRYAILALIVYVLLVFLFERYLMAFLAGNHPEMTPEEIREYANYLATNMKIFQYNIFIDLTLCSAFYYFTNETPKKIQNSKKKLILFRLCALIPIIYIVISMILSGLIKNQVILLPVEYLGLLTCRSPASYIVFFSVSLFLAYMEKRYIKKGGTPQGFIEYKKTNSHSLQFSVTCSIILLVVCLLDFLIGLIPGTEVFGIGDSKFMFAIIPFVMLISYTKEHKNQTIDLFLPLASFAIIFVLIIDTLFSILY